MTTCKYVLEFLFGRIFLNTCIYITNVPYFVKAICTDMRKITFQIKIFRFVLQ